MGTSINRATIAGNVGADPEIRSTQAGRQIATLKIATSQSWKDKDSGERKEKTQWHNIVVFNENLVKVVEQYVKKGTRLYVEGEIITRKWQDQSGQDKYTTEIVLQGFNSQIMVMSGGKTKDDVNSKPQPQQKAAAAKPTHDNFDNDDIQF